METIKRWRWRLLAIILLGGIAAWIERWRAIRENSQDPVILEAAARYGVDPALVKAVVWRESWFNPNARGRKGEVGLMQIREKTAEEWAAEEHVHLFTHFQMLDPVKNARAGTWYLRKLLRRYPRTDNPLPYALADYNAGRARVLQWSNGGAAATNSAAFLARMDYPGTMASNIFLPISEDFPLEPALKFAGGPVFGQKAGWQARRGRRCARPPHSNSESIREQGEARWPFARKPSGRRVFCPWPALARSLQPAAGMPATRRLGHGQNPSPQASC